MPEANDLANEKAKKGKQQGFFGKMSGIQKFLLIIFALGIFFVIWTFLFGGINNFYELIFFLVSFGATAVLFYAVLSFVSFFLAPEQFSPKKDYFNRLVALAFDLKPSNVQDIYFRGDKDKKRVRAGKITGLIGVPYMIGEQLRYIQDVIKEGKIIHRIGEPVFEYSNVLKKMIPKFGQVHWGGDGDTLFIYEAGWFLFKRIHYLRCHKSLHGDLNGDVEIYDINPVPYGSLFEYPFKQLQADPAKIMIQNQLEVILATHEHQYDLISQGVDSAVYFNPYFRLMQKSNAEMVAE